MVAHAMTNTSINQILGDVRFAIKCLGSRGRVTLTVEKFDGALVHRLEKSSMTEEDWRRVQEERPRAWRR
jgi:hypothetical protein